MAHSRLSARAASFSGGWSSATPQTGRRRPSPPASHGAGCGGEYRLTAGNWEGALETFGRRARASNYEIYFGGESVPTKSTDDLAGFVAAFERQPERYLLLAASGGEAEISFGPYLRAQLGRLGLLDGAPDRAGGYVAAVDAGETLLESYGYEAAAELAPDGLACALAAGRTGQFHRLDIDGISYGMCGTGINLVLYDKAQGCVVDNITLENADMPELSRQLYAFN